MTDYGEKKQCHKRKQCNCRAILRQKGGGGVVPHRLLQIKAGMTFETFET